MLLEVALMLFTFSLLTDIVLQGHNQRMRPSANESPPRLSRRGSAEGMGGGGASPPSGGGGGDEATPVRPPVRRRL